MSAVATAIGGAAVLGYVGSQNAANVQANAANSATNAQTNEFNTVNAQQAPYRAAGATALAGMQNPAFQQNFSSGQFQVSPGYEFALQQGNNALAASQAASGTRTSGAGLAALDQYNVGMANQQYQQAFNNFNTQNTTNFNRLASLAGLGQTANGQSVVAGTNEANQLSSIAQSSGNAQAGAAMAPYNIANNAIGQGAYALGYGNTSNPSVSGLNTAFDESPNSTLQAPSGGLLSGGSSGSNYNLG